MLQIIPIIVYHLFAVNSLRAFKIRLFKRISVFRLCVFPLWHNKGSNRACSYQPIRWKRAQWFVCVLIGSIGPLKRFDSEAGKRGCEETSFLKLVRKFKEGNSVSYNCYTNVAHDNKSAERKSVDYSWVTLEALLIHSTLFRGPRYNGLPFLNVSSHEPLTQGYQCSTEFSVYSVTVLKWKTVPSSKLHSANRKIVNFAFL